MTSRIATDPVYAARRAAEMHEIARQMDAIVKNEDIPAKIRMDAMNMKKRAEAKALDFDQFVR